MDDLIHTVNVLQLEGKLIVFRELLHQRVERPLQLRLQYSTLALDPCDEQVAFERRHNLSIRQVVELIRDEQLDLLKLLA